MYTFTRPAITRLLALGMALAIPAATGSEAQKIKGPHSGRVMPVSDLHLEFLVTKERTVEVRLFDRDMKPVPPGDRTIQVIAQAASGTQTLSLSPQENILVSAHPLPEGDDYPVVLRFKPSPDGAFTNHRFTYDTDTCAGCRLPEYACHCDSH